jgi:hypothetical protein
VLGCLCIRKFERELVVFWRDILPRGRGVRLGRFLSWLGLDRFWLGLAWLGSFLAGLGWIAFGWAGLDRFWPDRGLAKKKLKNFLRLRRA